MATVQLPYLHQMARKGNLQEVIRMLQLHPFLVNAEEGNSDWTPMMLAAREGHAKIVGFLLEHRADPNQCDRERWTALHWACSRGHAEVAQLLLKHGANPTLPSSIGQTPLMLAAMNGRGKALRAMLAQGGSPVNAVTRSGESALWWACYEGHADATRVLLLSRACPDLKDKRGRTALDVAVAYGHPDCARLIQEWNRGYLLYKVWCISDSTYSVAAPAASGCRSLTEQRRLQDAPSCLRQRSRDGQVLPSVTVVERSEESPAVPSTHTTPKRGPRGRGVKRRRGRGSGASNAHSPSSATAESYGGAGCIVADVASCVLREMKKDLFCELIEVMGRSSGY